MSPSEVELKQSGELQGRDRIPTKWEVIHRRLEAVQSAIERGSAPSAEEEKAILKARAKAMAQEPLLAQEDVARLEIVVFRLAHETYGFESRYIREVYALKELRPLPCTPPFVMGLVNVRGHLLSILDLKRFFGLPVEELDGHNQAIILHNEVMEFGILADSLLGMSHIIQQSLQPSLPTLTGIRDEFLLGITPERVIILDAEKLLSSHELIVHEEVEA